MKISIVTPAPPGTNLGNARTASRYARILRDLGHQVSVERVWNGRRCDALIALHARKSLESILAFRDRRPNAPLCTVLTGTDVYGDIHEHVATRSALELATLLIILQPLAADELAPHLRSRARVIFQSAAAPHRRPVPALDRFEVCVVGHLRTVKDPLRAAQAVRLLNADSRIALVLLGAAIEPGFAELARAEERINPRFRWLGNLPHARALRVLQRSRLFVQTSFAEGGSSALAEALVASIPVLATRVPGATGMLGSDHPGLFPVGDTAALAQLLERCEHNGAFVRRLLAAGRRVAWRFAPEQELEAWSNVIAELQQSG